MGVGNEGERTDAQVIAASLQDPEVFAMIFERHSTTVFKYLARQCDPGAAGDLLSETFTTAFRVRDRYDPSFEDAKPWLLGIATNVGRHHQRSEFRRRRIRGRLGDMAIVTPDENARADERMDATRQREELVTALGQLNPAHREVILLFASFDLSYEEIARALGVPMGTVRSRLSRARRELRERLGVSGQYEVVGEPRGIAESETGDENG